MNFAERLKDELDYQGFTVSDLAHFLGTKSSTIQGWVERGSIPAADTALRVAQFLNVSLEYLLTGNKEKSPERKTVSPVKNEITARIEIILNWKNISREEMLRGSGITERTFNEMVAAVSEYLPQWHALEKFLEVTPNYLSTGETSSHDILHSFREDVDYDDVIFHKFKALTDHDKNMVKSLIESAYASLPVEKKKVKEA